jgi:class 3 adenylate cyclase
MGGKPIRVVKFSGVGPWPENKSVQSIRILIRRAFSRAALSAVFNLDYALTESFSRVVGFIAISAFPAFHFYEKSLGYRDCDPMRIACTLLCLVLCMWPARRKWRAWRAAYWEFLLFFMMPFSQTVLFLLNRNDAYWAGSNVFWAFFLGIGTKLVWLPVHLGLGQLLAVALYRSVYGEPAAGMLDAMWTDQLSIAITALTGQGIKLALEVFHRRGLALGAANARAQEAESRENEIKAAYAELRRRENVIRRFVRPSVFEELARGEDPTEFRPVNRELAVMFCDIRDFTRLTEVLSAEEKQIFLNRYFSLMTGPILAHGGEVDKIMGDCVMGLFPDGRAAVAAAVEMRLRLQEFNREMYAAGKPKIRNGIGIAKGEVMLGNFGSFEKLDRTVIGEAVNIASRLESKTKMYNLEVVVTEDIVRDMGPGSGHCRWIDLVRVKGSSRRLKIYEVYGHQPPEVLDYKDRTRDMLEKALTLYFRKAFRDAARMFRALLAEVPPHRLEEGERMDRILEYYVAHCDAWNEDRQGAWELIERWDGVHVFFEK